MRNGGSLTDLQKILGHSSIQTTIRYTHALIGDLKGVHAAVQSDREVGLKMSPLTRNSNQRTEPLLIRTF